MSVTAITGDDVLGAEAPLLDATVPGSVNFNGLPAQRSKTGYWRSAFFIMCVEVAERFAYYGVSSNLISYLTGPLAMSTAAAAQNVNAWDGTAMLLPLLGAFVADIFLGRYRTIIFASLIYVLGMGFLVLSVVLHSWNSSHCTHGNVSNCSTLLEIIVFFSSLYVVAFAQGGHKPCVQAFAADQFDEEDKNESKEKSSFFNWWYFATNGGILASILCSSYIQENVSWELGYGIPFITMCLALLIFLLGSRTYRFPINRDERNPFIRIGNVFVKAARNWKTRTTEQNTQVESQQWVHLDDSPGFEFLNKASLGPDGVETSDIEDAKVILRFVPIWFGCLGYAVVSSQTSTLFIKQGATMDRRITPGIQVPAASLRAIVGVSIAIFVPIYDLIFVPIARAITKRPAGITMLQRIGMGLFVSFLSMVTAAIIERQRLSTAAEYDLVDKPMEAVPMSIWWLAPQYLLFGISDVFALVGLQEFFYDQIPYELKSVGLALCLSINGVGNWLSSLLISVIENATSGDGRDSWFSNNLNRAHLDYFYWLLASLSVVAMAAFLCFANAYVYKKTRNI